MSHSIVMRIFRQEVSLVYSHEIFNRLHAMFWALANRLLFCCCINRQQANELAMFYGERLHRA